jgi:hypothetical protein
MDPYSHPVFYSIHISLSTSSHHSTSLPTPLSKSTSDKQSITMDFLKKGQEMLNPNSGSGSAQQNPQHPNAQAGQQAGNPQQGNAGSEDYGDKGESFLTYFCSILPIQFFTLWSFDYPSSLFTLPPSSFLWRSPLRPPYLPYLLLILYHDHNISKQPLINPSQPTSFFHLLSHLIKSHKLTPPLPALDFIEKKTGHTMSRDTNEKITDGARGFYEKQTGYVHINSMHLPLL